MSINILIVGYGNIGRSVHFAVNQYPDLKCVGIVSRDPDRVKKTVSTAPIFRSGQPSCEIFPLNEERSWPTIGVDVAILCGGSKNDLPAQGPYFVRHISTVDSFDTHAHIGEYFDEMQPCLGYLQTMDLIAKQTNHTAHVCIGWDPGTFSLMRAYFTAVLGGAKAYAFYGLSEKGGLSMGHSNAIRDNVPGVLDARSYTHAKPEAIKRARSERHVNFTPRETHWRENFVVAAAGADHEVIRENIKNMPHYFAPYDVKTSFIAKEAMDLDHPADYAPHDGLVIAVSDAGEMEFRNTWFSNPAATAGILLAYARATWRLNQRGVFGAFSALDTPVRELVHGINPVALI